MRRKIKFIKVCILRFFYLAFSSLTIWYCIASYYDIQNSVAVYTQKLVTRVSNTLPYEKRGLSTRPIATLRKSTTSAPTKKTTERETS